MSQTFSYKNFGKQPKTYYGIVFPPGQIVSDVPGYIHDAEMISVPNPKVNVTFKDYDNSIIKELVVSAGEIPHVSNPTRKGHEFIGWSPKIMPAKHNTIYKATYRQLSNNNNSNNNSKKRK